MKGKYDFGLDDNIHPRFNERYGKLEAEAGIVTSSIHSVQSKSKMWMNDDESIVWYFAKKKPGPIRRFFYWLLLGWRWENCDV